MFTEHHTFWTNLSITGLLKGTESGVVTVLCFEFIIRVVPLGGMDVLRGVNSLSAGCHFSCVREYNVLNVE
jgi:hypothetical protein